MANYGISLCVQLWEKFGHFSFLQIITFFGMYICTDFFVIVKIFLTYLPTDLLRQHKIYFVRYFKIVQKKLKTPLQQNDICSNIF